jgi:hypothetical protein
MHSVLLIDMLFGAKMSEIFQILLCCLYVKDANKKKHHLVLFMFLFNLCAVY